MDSTILDIYLQKQLNNLCGFSLNQKCGWILKYRASRDGFDSNDFHKKCDGIRNTLTVIKATSGNIFGGFTEKAWESSGSYVNDHQAFIFSLINKENNHFIINCPNNGERAIGCYSNLGPVFGYGNSSDDIRIVTNSNINFESKADFGCIYKHPDYSFESDKAKNILAGSLKFQTVEIEVFTKVNN